MARIRREGLRCQARLSSSSSPIPSAPSATPPSSPNPELARHCFLCIVRLFILRRLLGELHWSVQGWTPFSAPASVSHLSSSPRLSTSTLCVQATRVTYPLNSISNATITSAHKSLRPLDMAQQQADNVMRRYARLPYPPTMSCHYSLRLNCTVKHR